MKTLTLLITILLTINFSNAQENEADKTITVTIENISNNKGKVLLSLHTEDTFMKGPAFKTWKAKL